MLTDIAHLLAWVDDSGDGDSWRERAACRDTDPDAFFPDKGGSSRDAKRICAGCDVRAECLADAIETDEQHGVRGGQSPYERKKIKKARRSSTA